MSGLCVDTADGKARFLGRRIGVKPDVDKTPIYGVDCTRVLDARHRGTILGRAANGQRIIAAEKGCFDAFDGKHNMVRIGDDIYATGKCCEYADCDDIEGAAGGAMPSIYVVKVRLSGGACEAISLDIDLQRQPPPDESCLTCDPCIYGCAGFTPELGEACQDTGDGSPCLPDVFYDGSVCLFFLPNNTLPAGTVFCDFGGGTSNPRTFCPGVLLSLTTKLSGGETNAYYYTPIEDWDFFGTNSMNIVCDLSSGGCFVNPATIEVEAA